MTQFKSCTRCQFLRIITKQATFEFNKETYSYDVKPVKPKFVCDFDKRHIAIESPNTFCCDNFQIKDEEEFAKIIELIKAFEIKGW